MPNFSSANKGTWFYYDPADESLGGVSFREITIDEQQRIENITVKTRKKFRRGVSYDDVKTDEELASKLRWDFCIVDWTETQLDGQDLDCTCDNKVKMMKVTDFVKFAVDSLSDLVEMNATLKEAQLGNLPSSSEDNLKNRTAKLA